MQEKTVTPQPAPARAKKSKSTPTPSLERDAREQAYMLLLAMTPTDVMH